MTRIIITTGEQSELEKGIQDAISVLSKGGIVVLPTDTIYGLACSPFNENAVSRIFEIKRRSLDMALPLLLSSVESADLYVSEFPNQARMLLDEFSPGALTLILPKKIQVPDIVTGGRDSVAVRIPDHPIPRKIADGIGGAIIGTSANRSGEPGITSGDAVCEILGHDVDMVLDAGETGGQIESTIVDLTEEVPVVRRIGAITRDAIETFYGHTVRVM